MEPTIEKICMLIASKNLTPRAFALKIGFNYSTLNNYLTGRRTTIDSELLIKILSSYDDVSAEWLLRGKGEMILENQTNYEDLKREYDILEARYNELRDAMGLKELQNKNVG